MSLDTDNAGTCPPASTYPTDPPLPAPVTPATIPPTASDDAYACPFNAACVVAASSGVLKNDTSTNTNPVFKTTGVVTQPPVGTLVLNTDGSFNYTPPKCVWQASGHA